MLKTIINRTKTSLLIASISLITLPSLAYESIDKAVAVVEESVILESELNQRLNALLNARKELSRSEALTRQVLDQLILEKLQLNIGKRINLEINEAEVDQAIANLKKSLSENNITFNAYLSQQKLKESQLRDSIRNELTLKRIQEGNINNRLRITSREIDDFLESNAGQEWLKTRYRLSHILLPMKDNNEKQMMAKAMAIYRQAESSPNSFQQLAAQNSAGPNAQKGGDLGWRTTNELPSLFVDQVENLKAGQMTQPFKSNAGIHILKMLQRSGQESVMIERFKVRHILVSPSELFTDTEAKAKADSLYKELLDGNDFIELAKKHTDDTGSKVDGGDLGWSSPGQFVPAFEKEMKKTPVGKFTQPFRSQFGWHILKVDDKKNEDMYDVVKRNQVMGILRQRRFGDELQLWLQEIRESAYVEVLI